MVCTEPISLLGDPFPECIDFLTDRRLTFINCMLEVWLLLYHVRLEEVCRKHYCCVLKYIGVARGGNTDLSICLHILSSVVHAKKSHVNKNKRSKMIVVLSI